MRNSLHILFAMLLFAGLSASAAYRSVAVERRDGSKLFVNIGDGMTAGVDGGMLVFSCDKGRVSIPCDEVWHWTFSAEVGDDAVWSGVSDVADGGAVLVREGGNLVLRNLAKCERVAVTAADGAAVLSGVAADGVFTVPSETLSAGVYIVSYGSHAVKILLGR